jgi:hypothetical protein
VAFIFPVKIARRELALLDYVKAARRVEGRLMMRASVDVDVV